MKRYIVDTNTHKVPSVRQKVHFDIGVTWPPVGSGGQIYGLKDVDNQLMAHFVIPQLHLSRQVGRLESKIKLIHSLLRFPHCGLRHKSVPALQKTLTESCPGSKRGRSRRAPGLVGDMTDMEGRSIFCDSKELEPAVEEKVSYHWDKRTIQ